MGKLNIVLVEDDPEVLGRLAQLIVEHAEYELLEAAPDFATGKQALLKHKPDVLLTDIGLPDGTGIDLIKLITEHQLDCEAMVISGFQDEHVVFEALEAGAKSYILKHDEGQRIVDAIEAMVNGGAPMSPIIARLMLKKFQQHDAEHPVTEPLTERQEIILKLISQGFSSREIAEKLDIRYYTVTTHIKNIYNKLQVNSRTEALHEAMRLGLIPRP